MSDFTFPRLRLRTATLPDAEGSTGQLGVSFDDGDTVEFQLTRGGVQAPAGTRRTGLTVYGIPGTRS